MNWHLDMLTHNLQWIWRHSMIYSSIAPQTLVCVSGGARRHICATASQALPAAASHTAARRSLTCAARRSLICAARRHLTHAPAVRRIFTTGWRCCCSVAAEMDWMLNIYIYIYIYMWSAMLRAPSTRLIRPLSASWNNNTHTTMTVMLISLTECSTRCEVEHYLRVKRFMSGGKFWHVYVTETYLYISLLTKYIR